jgi:hypothetical protein
MSLNARCEPAEAEAFDPAEPIRFGMVGCTQGDNYSGQLN